MPASVALMLLAGVYVGSRYGSSITAILINTPGAPASVAAVLDGYALHQRGESVQALGISLAPAPDVGWAIFVTRPISLVMLILAFASFIFPFVRDFRNRHKR